MKRILESAHRFLTRDLQKEREDRYLEGSSSIVDLEQRMREIDRGVFRPARY